MYWRVLFPVSLQKMQVKAIQESCSTTMTRDIYAWKMFGAWQAHVFKYESSGSVGTITMGRTQMCHIELVYKFKEGVHICIIVNSITAGIYCCDGILCDDIQQIQLSPKWTIITRCVPTNRLSKEIVVDNKFLCYGIQHQIVRPGWFPWLHTAGSGDRGVSRFPC